jgi:Ca2+-binding EF-hand superfamily protein
MVQSLMDAVDLDGSGCIDLSEFCASLMDASKLTRADHLQHVFEKLDTDKDGFLSVSELMQVSLSEWPARGGADTHTQEQPNGVGVV